MLFGTQRLLYTAVVSVSRTKKVLFTITTVPTRRRVVSHALPTDVRYLLRSRKLFFILHVHEYIYVPTIYRWINVCVYVWVCLSVGILGPEKFHVVCSKRVIVLLLFFSLACPPRIRGKKITSISRMPDERYLSVVFSSFSSVFFYFTLTRMYIFICSILRSPSLDSTTRPRSRRRRLNALALVCVKKMLRSNKTPTVCTLEKINGPSNILLGDRFCRVNWNSYTTMYSGSYAFIWRQSWLQSC